VNHPHPIIFPMKTNTATTVPTAGIELALRHLADNSEKKLSIIAAKFGKQEKDLWAWLTRYNGGKKDLSHHRIDSALANETAAAAPVRAVPAAVGERINRAVVKPERGAPPPVIPVAVRPPALTSNIGRWLEQQKIPIRAQVTCYQVEVTPAIAAGWLLLNDGNRNPSKAKIRRFAAALKAGKWALNGETVKFSITGRLLDGQSRLKAIVMAGVGTVIEVRAGLPDAAQKSMDIGETRKGTHTLEMIGEKYPNILSPALRWIFRWENDALSSKQRARGEDLTVLENMEIEPMLKRHAGLRASVGWCVSAGHRVAKLMPPGEAAFFHYITGQASASKRDSFFNALATGLGLNEKSPAWHLREKLQADRASTRRMNQRERLAFVIKAWNAHLAGQAMGQLVFINGGERREAFPTIAGVKPPSEVAA
jgi:hypothetical protein